MALKVYVVKAGRPDAGSLLGVFDAAALPPVPRDNDGQLMADVLDTPGQNAGEVWSRAARAFVAPAATPATKLDLEAAQLGALWGRWWRWKTSRDEAAARAVPAAVLTALSGQADAAWADYVAAINAWRAAS